MLSREILIDYIRNNDSEYTDKDLASFPFTTLVLIKVRIELEIRGNKTA
jgi:hypothetical protein